MNTIIFGNGLNLLTEGNASWLELVSIIDTDKNEERIPFTIVYYGNVEKGKSDLLSKLGADIVNSDCCSKKPTSYIKLYEYYLDKISEVI